LSPVFGLDPFGQIVIVRPRGWYQSVARNQAMD